MLSSSSIAYSPEHIYIRGGGVRKLDPICDPGGIQEAFVTTPEAPTARQLAW